MKKGLIHPNDRFSLFEVEGGGYVVWDAQLNKFHTDETGVGKQIPDYNEAQAYLAAVKAYHTALETTEQDRSNEKELDLNLSAADCEKLLKLTGTYGLTVSELLQGFIGDLIDGRHTHGSDERMYAEQWFERCGYKHFSEETLLRHLLEHDYDVDDFLTTYEEHKLYKEDPETYCKELGEVFDPEDSFWFETELQDVLDDWNPAREVDLVHEVSVIRQWVAEWDMLLRDSSFEQQNASEKGSLSERLADAQQQAAITNSYDQPSHERPCAEREP